MSLKPILSTIQHSVQFKLKDMLSNEYVRKEDINIINIIFYLI